MAAKKSRKMSRGVKRSIPSFSAMKKDVEAESESENKKYFWFFINAVLITIFVVGLWYLWDDWVKGLSIIVFDLLVIFFIKLFQLFLKLRKKKRR